jgi:hypothetical protein
MTQYDAAGTARRVVPWRPTDRPPGLSVPGLETRLGTS